MPSRSILRLACVTALLIPIGCRDATSTPAGVESVPYRPASTAAAGFTGGLLVQANVGEFHLNDYGDFRIHLKSYDNTDIAVTNSIGAPGAHSGWHSHLGPVLVAVKSGTFTVYYGDDPSCTPHVYAAGTTFIEGTGPHIVRNEGTTSAEFVAVFFSPAGRPRRIDQDAPGNCAF